MTHSPLPFFQAVTLVLTLNIRSQIVVCWFKSLPLSSYSVVFHEVPYILDCSLCQCRIFYLPTVTALIFLSQFSFTYQIFEIPYYSSHLNLEALLDPRSSSPEAFPGKQAKQKINHTNWPTYLVFGLSSTIATDDKKKWFTSFWDDNYL